MTDPDRFSAPFIAMFEALRMAPTFARGRRDARAGHVRSLTVSGSLVVARVRGPEEPTAYRARIAVRAFGAAEWSRVEDDLAAQARYVADLLAGRMPAGIEAVFARAGLSLLPLSLDEVAMDCTCERWPMPCIHLAATCYALAASFDTDPFGAFAWRGRPRDELLMRLHQLRGAPAAPPPEDQTRPDADLGDLSGFWNISGTPSATPPPPPASPPSPAGPSPATGPASAGLSPGVGSASAGVSPAAGLASAGLSRAAGPATAGVSPGVGSASAGVSPAAGLASAGVSPAAGRSSGGSSPGAGQAFVAGQPTAAGQPAAAGLASAGGQERSLSSATPLPPVYGVPPAGVVRPDALLDQLDPPPLAVGGRAVVDLLRPAYRALPPD